MFSVVAVLLATARCVHSKAVLAHFMIANSVGFDLSRWESDITLAQQAHIDAFALNMDSNSGMQDQITLAFNAANNQGFKLVFSFNYLGAGPWSQDSVISLLQQYVTDGAYYHYGPGNQPFVSTFEGPDNAEDWVSIKQQKGCFFVPGWSSKGAAAAASLADGVADGLFNWQAWPYGNNEMTTDPDNHYVFNLNGRPYMMAVSPWFYTNLPAFSKNWFLKTDDLWYQRWQQNLQIDPEFVEIITWNDFGESHYIAPYNDNVNALFSSAPFNDAKDHPHTGFLAALPYSIDRYIDGGAPALDTETLSFWYRLQPKSACSDGGTIINNGDNPTSYTTPETVSVDSIFYTALLVGSADITFTIGGVNQVGDWDSTPSGGTGLYYGSVPFNSQLGDVTVTVSRDGAALLQQSGAAIAGDCAGGSENWNVWTGSV
ncbi:glycoside hydrolase family 71 protein [Polychaeton citri CBS 116435]|uniref:Glycoside hydrolase family 71 protein n=1 Tax=Polychaeton citri CBS 116435 TaxID=1314669 RepID=A0A9P4QD40_9PEZI|nr:glycoside hydrolase family 71 protein [Polychaeton citri CBS 116435]